MTVHVEIPIATKNPTNTRENHFTRAKRVAKQRADVGMLLRVKLGGHWRTAFKSTSSAQLVVTLTRVSKGTLDAHDNLRAALKHVVDEIAAYFGVDDRNPRVVWKYAQERGKPARVRLSFDVVAQTEAA